MTDCSYRIKYRKGDFEIEIQGDKAWVEQKFKELTKCDISIDDQTPPSDNSAPPETKPVTSSLSIVEFLKSKGNLSSHLKRTMIFVYWLHHSLNVVSYNLKDIERCYSEAIIPQPKNLNDIMNKNQGRGYLRLATEEKEGKKTWVITGSGEDYVNNLK